MSDQEQRQNEIAIPVKLNISESIQTQYATHLAVQHTEHDFTIFFFEMRPPLLLGTTESNRQDLVDMQEVSAECVGRIVVAAGRMEEFIHALQDNFAVHRERFESTNRNDE